MSTSDQPRSRVPRPRPSGVAAALATTGALLLGVTGTAVATEIAPAPPVPAPATATDLTSEDVNAWLDGLIPGAIEKAGIAGAGVSVVHDGEVLASRGYGYSDTGTADGAAGHDAVPVDPDTTLFRVGSVSKLFTATAAMQLVESGELDLDTDIDEYLDFEVPTSFDTPITLRHLLTHTPGFEERVRDTIRLDGTVPDLRDILAADPPEQVYEPGTMPAYSNYGNALAGYLVEVVSGRPFNEYVDAEVLEPIGMSTASFEQPLPAEVQDAMSQGYLTDADAPAPFEIVGPAPAGSLAASPTEMAQFMLAQLGDTPETPLLSPETLELMHQPGLDDAALGTLAAGPRMTLGFFDESRNGHRIIGHGGDTNYFHSHLQIYPGQRTGIFVSFNSSGWSGADTLAIRDAVTSGFADRYFPAAEPAAEPAADPAADTEDTASLEALLPAQDASVEPTAREHAAMAAGVYETSRSIHSNFLDAMDLLMETSVVAREDGTLLISPGPGSTQPAVYEEVDPWVWREVGGQRVISMRVADGQVQDIGYASAFTLNRVEPARSAGVALPVLIGSMVVLVGALIGWLVGAILRRRYRLAEIDRAGRLMRILTRIGVGSALIGIIGWAMSIVTILGGQDIPAAVLFALLALQWLGMLAVIPAVWSLAEGLRNRIGWRRILGGFLVLFALVGVGWFAWSFLFLSPNLSY